MSPTDTECLCYRVKSKIGKRRLLNRCDINCDKNGVVCCGGIIATLLPMFGKVETDLEPLHHSTTVCIMCWV